ncbi:hypothetical protein EKO04_011632 [Ascochyta lentis]|uniref:Uncharacterized protein n=1 Tax=Ascochyta lentis TaxID=205686 RepID=A0A8H7IS56_9PLEO|nr:hypothetical protein EKO04_011632 [Ascochyta lentis]
MAQNSRTRSVCSAMCEDGSFCTLPARTRSRMTRCVMHERVPRGLENSTGRFAIARRQNAMRSVADTSSIGSDSEASTVMEYRNVNRLEPKISNQLCGHIAICIVLLLAMSSVIIGVLHYASLNMAPKGIDLCNLDRNIFTNRTGSYQHDLQSGTSTPRSCSLGTSTPYNSLHLGPAWGFTPKPAPCPLKQCWLATPIVACHESPGNFLTMAVYILANEWTGYRTGLVLCFALGMAAGLLVAKIVGGIMERRRRGSVQPL